MKNEILLNLMRLAFFTNIGNDVLEKLTELDLDNPEIQDSLINYLHSTELLTKNIQDAILKLKGFA